MARTKPLMKFYADVLASLNIQDVEGGRLSLRMPTGDGDVAEYPCVSNDKRVTLPTDTLLKSGEWDGLIPFHPLSENILRGESEIIHFLRRVIQFRLAGVSGALMDDLMQLATDTSRHADLSPTESEYLKEVPKVDSKTLKVLHKLLNAHLDEIIKIYLKRAGKIDGKEYRRVAAVSFPLHEELHTEGTKIFNASAGNLKNKKSIAALFEYIFPDPDEMDKWSAGSDSDVAPYFHSLMRCYASIAEHLNTLVEKHERVLSNPDILKTDLSWVPSLKQLSKWRDLIPALPGNEGAAMKGDKGPMAEESQKARHDMLASAAASAASMTSKEAPEVEVSPPWREDEAPRPTTATPKVSTPKSKKKEDEDEAIDYRSVMASRAGVHSPYAPALPMGGYQPTQMGGYQPAYGAGYPQMQMQPAGAMPIPGRQLSRPGFGTPTYGQPRGYGYNQPVAPRYSGSL